MTIQEALEKLPIKVKMKKRSSVCLYRVYSIL